MHIRVLAGKLDRTAGSHAYNLELIRQLSGRGHTLSVVAFNAVSDLDAETTVITPPFAGRDRLVWRLDALRNFKFCGNALKRAKLVEPDVVIGSEHLFLKAHKHLHAAAPFIYLPHSLVIRDEIKSYHLTPIANLVTSSLYVRLQRWALTQADCTLRFTQRACDALVRRYGSVRSKFFVNPMGTALPVLAERRARGTVKLLWMGQLIARKRIDVALSSLARARHLDWHFDIVGDGDQRANLERQARELGLAEKVTFHGFRTNPDDYYAEADLLLFSSWLENSPLTMLEAMAHGVPCLAMRADDVNFFNANAEIIRDGVDGFLAETYEDFAQKLLSLIQSPQRTSAAGAAARIAIETRHTWRAHLDRYEEMFDELRFARKRLA